MSKLRKLGELSSVGGALAVLLTPAADGCTWAGVESDDYQKACVMLEGMEGEPTAARITWGEGASEGVFSSVGRASSAELFRLASDELLLAPLIPASDWSEATEIAYLDDLGALPAKSSRSVGTIAVPSGILAVLTGAERARITDRELATVRSKGSSKRPWGVLAALPAGAYEVVYEIMSVEAPWGLLDCRLRIVPDGRSPTMLARRAHKPKRRAVTKTIPPPRHVLELEPGANRVASIAFSSDGTLIAAGAIGSSKAALWSIPEFARLATYLSIGPSARDFSNCRFWESVRVCFMGPSGNIALSVGERIEIREVGGMVLHRGVLVSRAGGEESTSGGTELSRRTMEIRSLEYDHAGPSLVLGGAHFPVGALSEGPTVLTELVRAAVPCITASHYARSPTGTRLLTSYPPLIVARAQAFTPELAGLALQLSNSSYFAWSPDERFVALIESYRARTVIFDPENGAKVAVIKNPSSRLEAHCLAFRPDGAQLAFGGSDGAVRLYDTSSWAQVLELPNHDTRIVDTHARSIDALAWSPDGRWLAVGNGLRDAPGALSLYASADLL